MNKLLASELLLFAGNPSSPADLAPLLAKLERNVRVIAATKQGHAPAQLWDDLSRQVKHDRVKHTHLPLTVAYSFGCYLALAWAQAQGLSYRTLVLVSPTLVTHQPVGLLTRMLSQLPLVAPLLFSKLAPKLAHEFVNKSLAPLQPSPAERAKLEAPLQAAAAWRQALALKVFASKYPLKADHRAVRPLAQRIIIVRGESDQSVPWLAQEQALKDLGLLSADTDIHILPHAGHCLPWLAAAELSEIIRSLK